MHLSYVEAGSVVMTIVSPQCNLLSSIKLPLSKKMTVHCEPSNMYIHIF